MRAALATVLACLLCLPAAEAATKLRNPTGAGSGWLEEFEGRGTEPPSCAAAPNIVTALRWIETGIGGDCLAYFATANVAGARQAIIYLEGDVPSHMLTSDRLMRSVIGTIIQRLEQRAQRHRQPYIFLARPGVWGSSGNHARRRSWEEMLSLSSAVDRLKLRLGLEQIALAGQSGGGTAVGALLTLGRSDIACAAVGSGGFGFRERQERRTGETGRLADPSLLLSNVYEPLDRIAGIRPDPRRRVFIIGDPRDTITPYDLQRRFAEAVKAGGHHAVALEGRARDPSHHGMGAQALDIATWCVEGLSDSEIKRRLGGAP